MIHACHQRTFNDRNSFGIQLQRFGKVFFQIIADTLCQGVLQPFFHRSPLSPGKLGMGGSLPLSSGSFRRLRFRFQAFGSFYQTLGSIGTTVQDHILYALQYISGNIGVKKRISEECRNLNCDTSESGKAGNIGSEENSGKISVWFQSAGVLQ